ncbi:MAG: hypothetical protein HY097_07920 [Nitrospinae bacterium]|nr:hypothetical protein [Nitrospinota bacterium]
MIARIADWVTLITAPLTIIGTMAAWFGWIGLPTVNTGQSETAATAVAALLIVVVWSFFFFGHLRIVAGFSQRLSDTAAFGAACIVSLLTLVVVCSIEILILDALIPSASFPLVQLVWLAVPILAWLLFGYYAVILVSSGEYRRDAL